MIFDGKRRAALFGLGTLALGGATFPARAASSPDRIVPPGARNLSELIERLRQAPRRRDFKSVPMIVAHPDFWDAKALNEVIAYSSAYKQVWDNTDIASPWLNLMRNAVNAQIFSFDHPDFLAVSGTHGTAHLALFDQAIWDKYKLATLAGAKFKSNSLIVPTTATRAFSDYEDPSGLFGASGNRIPVLQERGVVFLGCHNAIWELTAGLIARNNNPDHLSHEALAAEFTNHLIEGVVLTPGVVATIPELQQAGFHYAT